MKEKVDAMENFLVVNGLNRSFLGSLNYLRDGLASFFREAQHNKWIYENIVILLESSPTNRFTMADIALINYTIQKESQERVSVIMNIQESFLLREDDLQLTIYYLLDE